MGNSDEMEALRQIIRTLDPKRADALIRQATAEDEPERHTPADWDSKWKREPKRCPKCGETKMVVPGFGVRFNRGVQRPQPWCSDCRAKTNYYKMPRKNRSVVYNPDTGEVRALPPTASAGSKAPAAPAPAEPSTGRRRRGRQP